MEEKDTITITSELIDLMVDSLSHLPYRDVAAVFAQLAGEIEAQNNPNIIIN